MTDFTPDRFVIQLFADFAAVGFVGEEQQEWSNLVSNHGICRRKPILLAPNFSYIICSLENLIKGLAADRMCREFLAGRKTADEVAAGPDCLLEMKAFVDSIKHEQFYSALFGEAYDFYQLCERKRLTAA